MNGWQSKFVALTLVLLLAVPGAAFAAAGPGPLGTDDNPGATTQGRGADDAPGDNTQGRGADDNPGDNTQGRGADDAPGDNTQGRGADDNPGDNSQGRGADDPAGHERHTGTDDPAGKEHGTEVEIHREAVVAAQLQAMINAGVFTDDNVRMNMESVIAQLLTDTKGRGAAEDDVQVLSAIENVIMAEGQAATFGKLDLLAAVQVRQGKHGEAKTTLKLRLEKNPATLAAYDDLLELEFETGERVELETFVSGRKVTFDVQPMLQAGRTLTPIRKLAEAMGAEVEWEAETRMVKINKGATVIQLQIGSNVALIGGREVELEVPAQIVDDRTLIPARAVVEGLGFYVNWLDDHRSIVITEQPLQ